MDATNDLFYWPVLRHCSIEFLNKVKKIFVFHYGKSCLLITNDDRVYGCGNNHYGRLGIGFNSDTCSPTPIEQLCGKAIKFAIEGSDVMFCLTENGLAYSWGYTLNGRTGVGNQDMNNQYSPKQLPSISNCVKIVCGKDHQLALDQDGVVWAWGGNTYGQLGNKSSWDSFVPFMLEIEDVQDIAASWSNSMALVGKDVGQVYFWGRYLRRNYNKPEKILYHEDLPGVKFKAVVAVGFDSFLLLDQDGQIYEFNCLHRRFKFTKIDVPFEIVSIHSDCRNVCAFLRDKRGYFHVWDSDQPNKPVVQTTITSLSDVQYLYCRPITLTLTKIKARSISLLQESRFNDKNTSDVNFSFNINIKPNKKSKLLYANREILIQKSKYFKRMFEKNGPWEQKNEIIIKDYSFVVYFAYLRYLYTGILGIVEFDSLEELMKLATENKEKKLKQKCAKQMENHIEKLSFEQGSKIETIIDNETDVINLDNFLNLFNNAIQTSDLVLCQMVIDFVKNNRQDSFQSKTFINYQDERIKHQLIHHLIFNEPCPTFVN